MSAIRLLEKFLQYWEDACFVTHVVGLLTGERTPDGAAREYESLRNDILRCGQGERLPERYFKNVRTNGRTYDVSVQQEVFVHSLSTWATHSRRIFRLSNTMQHALSGIAPGNVTLGDVHLPFPAFCVEFAIPLLGDQGDEFPLALVSSGIEEVMAVGKSGSVRTMMHIQLIGRRMLENYVPINRAQKAYALKMLRKDDRFKLQRHALSWATLLVMNLCLYLDSMQSTARAETEVWRTPPREPGQFSDRVVTDGAQICEISSRHLLDSMMEPGIGEGPAHPSGYEVRPHWRRGHGRRRPGSGNDPEAPKAVRVKVTLVRGDRLPENALPQGSATDLTQ